MARQDINRSGEMEVFIAVVEAGSFSAAARRLAMTPSAVSKLVARLERRLDARLVSRSTRQIRLTPEGRDFFERASAIIASIEDAERAAGAAVKAVGRIRLNSSSVYCTHVLNPLLPDFLSLYPGVTLDIAQTDQVIDLVADHTDVAIRAGPMKSSSLLARKLGETEMVVAASPAYLQRFGRPKNPADLAAHNLLSFSYTRSIREWPFRQGEETVSIMPSGAVQVNDGEGMRQLALAGVGIVRMGTFALGDDLAAGRLVPLLEDFNPGDREPFYAVYVGQGGPLPSRVRALLDFLAGRGRVG
ncbi:LysR family transcriptional regulator [Rhizobium sp. SSA_523]|uniref:LysR family transcriptional regulator n=1 Tax=Rhizobium sp. SSA_523 TaxID=2952477 RepID=UPI002090FCDE|nr:LysR family transcriptional regulator [Rhizobium sp. SSA_523]MCO5730935.1 LysR family transcriptional regulator [Rhizobium sp. SSA_523]WKC24253.1 LysR family transcriptional regulator [Rhizobium sp. SSA_523]